MESLSLGDIPGELSYLNSDFFLSVCLLLYLDAFVVNLCVKIWFLFKGTYGKGTYGPT